MKKLENLSNPDIKKKVAKFVMVRGSTWDENEPWQAVVKSTEVHGCVAETRWEQWLVVNNESPI